MKFTKPTYDPKQRLYTCDVTDGFRFSVRRESGAFVKPVESCIDSDERIAHLIKSTQGWFSKPLTADSLKGKIHYDIPTHIAETFEGLVEWQIQRLIISKEQFLFVCSITQTVEDEKVSLEFPEEPPEQVGGTPPATGGAEEEIPFKINEDVQPLGIGPTRRRLQKEEVMSARAKAARALFNAERLTQEFYQTFGETDWEDED